MDTAQSKTSNTQYVLIFEHEFKWLMGKELK